MFCSTPVQSRWIVPLKPNISEAFFNLSLSRFLLSRDSLFAILPEILKIAGLCGTITSFLPLESLSQILARAWSLGTPSLVSRAITINVAIPTAA